MRKALFRLTAETIDVAGLRASLENPACGACVAFEGLIRNHNEGRRVLRLEYEAYAALANKEGEAIVRDALAKFGIEEAVCVHRTGLLEIGEMAVWVGAASAHRGEAFKACSYIIDTVKQRVPIWKREHYADGTDEWVNCAACAPGHEHPPASGPGSMDADLGA
jgi:molybdopterin synthase catalytic subunit